MARLAVNHLVQRGRIFYFRKAIPTRLRQRFGRSELVISLNTSDPAQGTRHCRALSGFVETFFMHVEQKPHLSPEEINGLLRQHFSELLAVNKDVAYFGPQDPVFDAEREISQMVEQIGALRKRLVKQAFGPADIVIAERLVASAGITWSELEKETRDTFLTGLLRAQIEQNRLLILRLQGDPVEAQDPLFRGLQEATRTGTPKPGSSKSVKTLVASYISLRQQSQTWVKKTRLENERILNLLVEFVGPDCEISQVARSSIQDFRDRLLRLPTNFTKHPEYASKSFLELTAPSKLSEVHTSRLLSQKTANRYFSCVTGFFNWCAAEGDIERSPAAGIKIPGKAKTQGARLPFSTEQLQKFFHSPLFVGHKSIARRAEPGSLVIRDGKFWAPLIALFSGMRAGEIVQLGVVDIKSANQIWYFDLTPNEDAPAKELKTESSARKIPIHPMLLQLGLLAHVESRSKSDKVGRLFPDIQPGADGYHSHNFSKFFNRYTTAIKTKTPRTTFHSFRHSFKDALVEAGIEDSHIKALLGHADNSITAGYGSKYSVSILSADINKVQFPVDLSHLTLGQN